MQNIQAGILLSLHTVANIVLGAATVRICQWEIIGKLTVAFVSYVPATRSILR